MKTLRNIVAGVIIGVLICTVGRVGTSMGQISELWGSEITVGRLLEQVVPDLLAVFPEESRGMAVQWCEESPCTFLIEPYQEITAMAPFEILFGSILEIRHGRVTIGRVIKIEGENEKRVDANPDEDLPPPGELREFMNLASVRAFILTLPPEIPVSMMMVATVLEKDGIIVDIGWARAMEVDELSVRELTDDAASCEAFAFHWVRLPDGSTPGDLFVVTKAARFDLYP
ncbi:hypothetical protein DRJ24_06285 [Candidatus Acetothermia bacterium]|nr:MAG: hypothetical protein DRJ24_06285 [Candidatus Acetothermia bacterium]